MPTKLQMPAELFALQFELRFFFDGHEHASTIQQFIYTIQRLYHLIYGCADLATIVEEFGAQRCQPWRQAPRVGGFDHRPVKRGPSIDHQVTYFDYWHWVRCAVGRLMGFHIYVESCHADFLIQS